MIGVAPWREPSGGSEPYGRGTMKQTVVVIGLGEVGKPLLAVLQGGYQTFGFVVDLVTGAVRPTCTPNVWYPLCRTADKDMPTNPIQLITTACFFVQPRSG